MILEKDIGQGHRWYFGIGESSVRMSLQPCVESPKLGMGTAMLCFAAIGFLHHSLDEAHSTLLRRWIRLCVRILFAVFFITFPLVPTTDAIFDLGINTFFLALVVISETVGKISLQTPLSDESESGGTSKEDRAHAAGFKIEDLTPYEK